MSSRAGRGPSEAELVARAQAGDDAAYRTLVERYTATLRAQVRRRLARPVLQRLSTADVLQEALVVAWQRIGDFEPREEGSFGRWLSRIVEMKTRRAVERHVGAEKRNAFREAVRSARPATRDLVGRIPTPSQEAMRTELAEAAERALLRLRDDDQLVLRLLQRDDVGLEEAARQLERSVAATRKLYSRALARYALLLREERGGLS